MSKRPFILIILILAFICTQCHVDPKKQNIEAKTNRPPTDHDLARPDMHLYEKFLKNFTNRAVKRTLPTLYRMIESVNISTNCLSSLFKYVVSLKEIKVWAMKMFDATAKIPSGIFSGTVSELGAFDQCLAIVVKNKKGFEDFRGQYCSVEAIPTLGPRPKNLSIAKKTHIAFNESITKFNYLFLYFSGETSKLRNPCLQMSCQRRNSSGGYTYCGVVCLDWDEIVPDEIVKIFNDWCDDLRKLSNIRITRHYFSGALPKDIHNIELHLFSDASIKAYGTVAYLRVELSDGNIITSFVASKGRVAPLKTLSLSRLELMGALLSARLSEKNYMKGLEFPVQRIFWTDSSIVFFWIKGSPDKFKVFIKNRIQEIHKCSNPSEWFHCPGKENPGDLISRGLSVAELENSHFWWQGPSWLREKKSS
ncbi:integrase catalytic domain-containing protein [Trichonephila inaurata madagascariensis]|uniref:Integrase catalytic domain-containing protein n=1 Tax=Trichonephila inaurata madagascariensis TaxID=2747483 RepID=A0A8X6YW59_9ARAC|nr:integrase catalytic domain-containing protein [Trichonephila inaurata madagascariensis]